METHPNARPMYLGCLVPDLEVPSETVGLQAERLDVANVDAEPPLGTATVSGGIFLLVEKDELAVPVLRTRLEGEDLRGLLILIEDLAEEIAHGARPGITRS